MKKTKGQIACILLQAIFMFVVPIVILWLQYGNNAFVSMKYKISLSGIIFGLMFFLLSKRFWLDGYLKNMQGKISQFETQATVTVDITAIESSKRAYKRLKYLDLLLKSIMPIIILIGITVVIKALEEQAIKLYGVFMMSTISFIVGVVFKIVEIALTHLVNEPKKVKEKKK